MENFDTLGLPNALLASLQFMQFTTPTPIQAQTIPLALKGSDILGSAQTGTGKTAAYGIPLVAYLLNSTNKTALVLTPTRELAGQVLETLRQLLGRKTNISSALLIGGDSMGKQLDQLKSKPRLIVGTPGRINDHLSRGSLKLNQAEFLVLDETDRMLDLGFDVQIEKIATFLPPIRQTLMFSATMPPNIIKLSQQYLNNAERIAIGSVTSPIEKIKQENISTTEIKKYEVLVMQLEKIEGSFIIFVKTKIGTEKLAKRLYHDGHSADAIHGDLRQRDRDKVIRLFKGQKNRILVATDVAARGLDIPHITCVVNYDLPQCPQDYIHRIGRTGRAGADGTAINFLTSQDNIKWKAIAKLLGNEEDVPTGRRPSRFEPRNGNGGGGRFDPKNSGAKKPFNRSGSGFGPARNNNSPTSSAPKRRTHKSA